MKNFSSLKAIISGLQSNPIYRLEKTWSALAKDKVELFEELARIFSEENNQWAQRELLIREGTAKFADTVGQNDKQLQKVFQKRLNNTGVTGFCLRVPVVAGKNFEIDALTEFPNEFSLFR